MRNELKGKKLLIIGAGIEQVQAVMKAKEMGHFVIVTDMSPNAPAISFADRFFKVSTTDWESNLRIALEERIDGVLTVCSETAVPTVAAVAEKLSLPGFSKRTASLATNKEEMRKVFLANGVPVSNHLTTSVLQEALDFCRKNRGPWIFKPIDSSGQRGTSFVKRIDEVPDALNYAIGYSSTGRALIDQFLEGPEYHITMQVIEGEIHFLAISDRITLSRPNFGVAVRHIAPSSLQAEVELRIKQICEKAVSSIELQEGVVTCELIVENDEPKILEIAIRVPGGYLREVALYSSGIDIVETTIQMSLGELPAFSKLNRYPSHGGVSVLFLSPKNIDDIADSISDIKGINLAKKVEGIEEIKLHFNESLKLTQLKTSTGRFGAIIGTGKDPKTALMSTNKAFNQLKINGKRLIDYSNYSSASLSQVKEFEYSHDQ